ncbi:hypothetical protein DM01DRAFT_1006536 [Hesseltinella vesiculosa]|uniref:Uncharacterized protein n=1 Tax=Hesseltinella vesiculosa TaxID=101127 RepID=A0A1X2GXJ8_9FUNG|nr:hypothetical protein DM01DRAFT_1006536 [Hesseltinella vesiculosa]
MKRWFEANWTETWMNQTETCMVKKGFVYDFSAIQRKLFFFSFVVQPPTHHPPLQKKKRVPFFPLSRIFGSMAF